MAFAEITVGGSVGAAAIMAKGSNVNGDDVRAGNKLLTGNIEASAQNETDTFGGSVQIQVQTVPPGAPAANDDPFAYGTDTINTDFQPWSWTASVWYKPAYFLQIQLGVINDLALTEIVGWGYQANDADDYVIAAKGNYVGDYLPATTGFYSGTGQNWTGLTVTLSPLYGLDISLAVPFGKNYYYDTVMKGVQQPAAGDVYRYSQAQVAYTLYDFGRLAVSFVGGGDGQIKFMNIIDSGQLMDTLGQLPYDPVQDGLVFDYFQADSSALYASFLLTALENWGIDLNIGFGYTFPATTTWYSTYDSLNYDISYNPPMEAGLGFSWGTANYGIKARAAATFGGTAQMTGQDTLNEAIKVGFGILPYYSIGICRLYLNLGISYKFADEYIDSTTFKVQQVQNSEALGWYVNPYLTVTIDSAKFFAGVQVETDGLKYVGLKQRFQYWPTSGVQQGVPVIEWSVPIGIMYEF